MPYPLENNQLRIYYNNQELSPTPLINYSNQPVSFGYVYGYNTEITLEGIFTGIDINGPSQVKEYLSGIFFKQFKTLYVYDDNGGGEIYRWDNVYINSINVEQSQYISGSFVKYTIKALSYNIPSGVIDPSNEYSFQQNEDGTVNVNHKISARGIKNSQDAGAFENAVAFVQSFKRKNPFNNCIPIFVPNGNGFLISESENINRAEGIYSITEVYKYRTGESQDKPALRTTSLDIQENLGDEFKSINYNLKINGSPVEDNIQEVMGNYLEYDVLSDISSEFGLGTTDWVKNDYSFNVDSGAATIDIKINYLSGAPKTGFFDYTISCNQDYLMGTEDWNIQGDFRCFGPLNYRRFELNNFKNSHKANGWKDFLTNLITTSPLYIKLHNPLKEFSKNFPVKEDETLDMASLKLSFDLKMGYEPDELSELKYSIEGKPSKWIYELLPSATIEGAYVVQDLRTKTRDNISFNLSTKTSNKNLAVSTLSDYFVKLSGVYLSSIGFLNSDSINTGLYDVTISKSFLGDAKPDMSTVLTQLQSDGYNNNASVRQPNYLFGY